MRTFKVEYERDETGWWVATVEDVDGCFTQGRSLNQARSRVHEALHAALPDLGPYELQDEVKLPPKARTLLSRRESAKRRLADLESREKEATRRAARTLIEELDLSYRDAGEVLGLSHQRVQQLIQEQGS